MWLKIKAWLANFWLKIKAFGQRFSAYWVSALAIMLMIIVGGAWLINRDAMNNQDNTRNPQIAQVFEPSIGEPLAPTTEPFDASQQQTDTSTATPATDTPQIEEVVGGRPVGPSYGKVAGEFVAPATGVNLATIPYANAKLGFATEIPARAKIDEASDHKVRFVSPDTGLLYQVESYGHTTETIDTIFTQIKGSTNATTVELTEFQGQPAVKYNITGVSGAGVAVIWKGRLFYLVGDHTYFASFQAI